jgi:hypothetical protein
MVVDKGLRMVQLNSDLLCEFLWAMISISGAIDLNCNTILFIATTFWYDERIFFLIVVIELF